MNIRSIFSYLAAFVAIFMTIIIAVLLLQGPKAKANQLTLPLQRVPRAYDFHEGELRKYRDLVEIYSKFSIAAKGYCMENGKGKKA